MTLLDALNICLSALGEFRVTSDRDRHPTVDILRETLASKKLEVLERGWWFNTYTSEMYPDENGAIEYPVRAISVQGPDSRILTKRNGMLFDMDNYTSVFKGPVRLKVIEDVDFPDLPEAAANCVCYTAAAAQYANDLGTSDSFNVLGQQAESSWNTLEMLHLRNLRYNTKHSAAWGRYRSALLNC